MKTLIPPIKSQGIKTKLIPAIKEVMPKHFNGTWVEPFMGTGVVGFNIANDKAIFADTNPHLINFYNALKSQTITALKIKEHLEKEGSLLLEKGEEHYYFVRERFNLIGNPLDFIFINRSCFNGMIRFNRKGGFNVPFCRKPQRFAQAYVTKIFNQALAFEKIIKNKDFTFLCQPYTETIKMANPGDVIYCDPPYIERHSDYFNSWSDDDEMRLFQLLCSTKSEFILSTWHSNSYRDNVYIDKFWKKFNMVTREHFYHVGGKEENRNPMREALIMNFQEPISAHLPSNLTPVNSQQLSLML
mgnify:CR=1 FL=1